VLDSEFNVRLNTVIDDVMVQFPIVARKILIATKAKTSPVSSGIKFRLLEGLMASRMTPSEISQLHYISKPNVTTLISKLIEGGLAQRTHDERDRRVIYVSITDKGKKTVLRNRKIVKEYLLKIFDQLNADEIEDVFSAMAKFRNLLIKMNNIL
jgi:DNA-binding MarR family transcriptional regulator